VTDFEVRRADMADLPGVLDLAQAALGWRPDDPNDAFFRWKHLDNPAGPSPMWLASHHGKVLGFRVFLRWRFRLGDGSTALAVRAVDTATSPDHQRQGIFQRLTLHGLDELPAMGIDLVFNTPNARSHGGYLKMGWQTVGRVPISVRPHGARGVLRMARASGPADKWSAPSTAGDDAPSVLADPAVETLLQEIEAGPHRPGLATDRTIEHLRWRYGFDRLGYRAVVADSGPAHGIALFRTRTRGGAVEAVLCDLLTRPGDTSTARRLTARAARAAHGDYLLAAGRPVPTLVPVPRQGPVLTWRPVGAMAAIPLAGWRLSMGDVELF